MRCPSRFLSFAIAVVLLLQATCMVVVPAAADHEESEINCIATLPEVCSACKGAAGAGGPAAGCCATLKRYDECYCEYLSNLHGSLDRLRHCWNTPEIYKTFSACHVPSRRCLQASF